MGGQYLHTGQIRYLWLLALVISCDLLRYLNAGQVTQLREAVEQAQSTYGRKRSETLGGPAAAAPASLGGRVKASLAGRRIRTHLISGIEFEMAVFDRSADRFRRRDRDRRRGAAGTVRAPDRAVRMAGHPLGGDSQPRDSLRTRPAQHAHRCFCRPAIIRH